MGLDKAERIYYGAAPLSMKTLEFFQSLNMPLINSYGLSETAAAVTHHTQTIELGTAGRPAPGMDFRIFNPDDDGVGEICMRGRNIFMGYMNDAESS